MSAGQVIGVAYDQAAHPPVVVGHYVETADGRSEYRPVQR